MKLTPDLIQSAVQTTNPLRERELDLRGYKVALLENLSATLDQFDTLDLSDNEIRKLDGFPHLKRLSCLVLNNNKVARIGDTLSTSLPSLRTLVLTNNNLQELEDLEPLGQLRRLQFLSLAKNPVCGRKNYRLHVVGLLPGLRFLDFRRVRDNERRQAAEFFAERRVADAADGKKSTTSRRDATEADGDNGAVSSTSSTSLLSRTAPSAVAVAAAAAAAGGGPSSADLVAIRDAIKKAQTLDEVERLNRLLSSGDYAGFAKQQQQLHQLQQQQQQQQSA